MNRLTRVAALAAVLVSAPAAAQQTPAEPKLSELVRVFQKDYLTLGVLLQVVGDVQNDRNQPGQNGFSIANARVRLMGELDNGFDYFVRGNFIDVPTLLDLWVGYKLTPSLGIRGGLFKAPFSREFLTDAGAIDFVNRSQVVAALAPNRQTGAMLRGRSGIVEHAWGVFNGNQRVASGNDNDELMLVGRVSFWPNVADRTRPNDRLEVGLNAAYSDDAAAQVGNLLPTFNGLRRLYGADVRWHYGKWLVAAEGIAGELDFRFGPTRRPDGVHATVGYMTSRRTQVLARWDDFKPDGLGVDQQLLVLGWNFWPTRATEVQINGVTPTNRGGLQREQLLVNLQVAF